MESNGNKMVEVSYRYDHENNKLRRESDGNTVEYMYDFEGKLLYESEGTRKRSYVYMGRSLVGFSEGGRKYHVITDETGSVRKIYKDGEEEWSGTYSPYGKLSSYEGSFEFSGMYAGKEIDTETGLTYHWNRWRNEEGDAFISEDPIRDGYNWYGYALGNPFRYADGTGLATYVCRDGTFCNEGDISNPSYRADCYHYNGYNAGTIASMSGPAYNLANNGGQATLSLAGTRADPGRNKSSPSAAEEIKNCGNVDVEKITLGKISDTVELLEVKAEVDERITELVVYMPVIGEDGRIHDAALFGQHAWTMEYGFEEKFNENACCATDLVNIASIFYTIETGNTLSFDQAIKTMMSAVGKKDGIDKNLACVENYQNSINYMMGYLGLSTKLLYNEGKGEIILLPLAAKEYETVESQRKFVGYNTNNAGHFILNLDYFFNFPSGTNYCHEPDSNRFTFWASDGRSGVRTGDNYIDLNGLSICRPLQAIRAVRAFDVMR